MKHTPIADEYALQIRNIISEIEKLNTADESYDFQELREMLRDYKGYVIQIHGIDIKAIKDEFWDACASHAEIANWLQVYKVKFKAILNWKAGSTEDYIITRSEIQSRCDKFLAEYELHSGFEQCRKEAVRFKNFFFRLLMSLEYLRNKLEEAFEEFEAMSPGSVLQKIEPAGIVPSKFRIAKNKKTDFIKIISAMYDARIFETEDGFLASSKQAVFYELGKVFNADFSSYSTILTQSKETERRSFMKPFQNIAAKAEEYFEKNIEK